MLEPGSAPRGRGGAKTRPFYQGLFLSGAILVRASMVKSGAKYVSINKIKTSLIKVLK